MTFNEDFTASHKLRDIGRWYVTQFVEGVARALPPGTRLLDAGAGECAYKRFFSKTRYVSVDAAIGNASWNYGNLDCVSALDRLPFMDQSFDAVLCTQTLEHLEWPRECVREFFLILKPGGMLYLTAPMAHPEHQAPHDFFRYTSFGLKSLCRGAGFTSIEVVPFGGNFTRMAYELPSVLSVFPATGWKTRQWKLRGLVWLPVKAILLAGIRIIQLLLLGMDRLDTACTYPFGWRVVARK
jgi:SAM-dependent methyltransferase